MTPSYVRKRFRELTSEIGESKRRTGKLQAKLKKLQEDCKHPNKQQKVYEETGYEGRSYRYEVCPDCKLGYDRYQ